MTVLTGQQITYARYYALKSALKLEILGMHRKGKSAYSIIKQEFGLKGSKKKVYDQFTKLLEVSGD